MSTIVHGNGIVVDFGGVRALDGVGLRCHSGEVVGLIGSNGAGKTTLLNVLSGFIKPKEGVLYLEKDSEKSVNLLTLPAEERSRLGVSRTFQNPKLSLQETVRENIVSGIVLKRGNRDVSHLKWNIDELIVLCGLTGVSRLEVGNVAYGYRRLCEVARALANEPRLLLLDEPSSGMNDYETERLAEVVLRVASEGVGVIMVEHDMGLVRSVCGSVVALDLGKVIAMGTPSAVLREEVVVNAFLGGAVAVEENIE